MLCSKRLADDYSGKGWTPGEQMVYVILVFSPQVPELFGPIRTIAEGRGETVLIGTTKHFVLQGSLDGEFIPITQVDALIDTSQSRAATNDYFYQLMGELFGP